MLNISVADVRSLDSNKKNELNDQCSHVNQSKCSKNFGPAHLPAPTQFQPATRNPRPLVKLNCRVTQADYSSGQKTQADFSSGQKTTGSRSSYLANYGLFQLYTTA